MSAWNKFSIKKLTQTWENNEKEKRIQEIKLVKTQAKEKRIQEIKLVEKQARYKEVKEREIQQKKEAKERYYKLQQDDFMAACKMMQKKFILTDFSNDIIQYVKNELCNTEFLIPDVLHIIMTYCLEETICKLTDKIINKTIFGIKYGIQLNYTKCGHYCANGWCSHINNECVNLLAIYNYHKPTTNVIINKNNVVSPTQTIDFVFFKYMKQFQNANIYGIRIGQHPNNQQEQILSGFPRFIIGMDSSLAYEIVDNEMDHVTRPYFVPDDIIRDYMNTEQTEKLNKAIDQLNPMIY